MNHPAATFFRLLGALEDLAAQESIQLAGEDYAAVRRTQERAAPLVEELARQSDADLLPAVASRVERLLTLRRQNERILGDRVASTRAALAESQQHHRRIAQVAPAYGRRAAATAFRPVSRTHAIA